ncbi:hypothetical protein CONPUDRAFT_76226 [Coniophora puteana RWD-64-598 SS2]|uniref:GH3 auxin-responsive promoter n=1 Tax=Coniophora puteana (strain RWD-64-598) TaxID=741705 RepID=A0A5M3MD69_CONPW|nr:uncharacterized protein CONPUDRAFT_76226 [Coniophora puteana RWD-64-598 SS2]EIW76591.1 hypothetical protein CONPUDRAFT_76226 [Coniophora puteana RWD-64-598 SS2]
MYGGDDAVRQKADSRSLRTRSMTNSWYPSDIAPLPSLGADLASQLQTKVEDTLRGIISRNLFNSQFGRTSDLLAGLRRSLTGANLDDPKICADAFAAADLPLTEYDIYEPYIAKFTQRSPARLSDVADLLAPGLPRNLGKSSSTSGKASKLIPNYWRDVKSGAPSYLKPGSSPFRSKEGGVMCIPVFTGYMSFVDVCDDETGGVTRIPSAAGTAYASRAAWGFTDFERDHERLSESIPGLTAPFGVGLIVNYRSLMLTHAAFALAEPAIDTLSMLWSTAFVDFVRWIDEEWDVLVSAIANGELPRFPDTESVHSAVATTFRADTKRARELRMIGPPSRTTEGWAVRVWPQLEVLSAICSGTFERVLPQVRAYIGPSIIIRNPVYASSECAMGISYHDQVFNVIKTLNDGYIEMLEITADGGDGELKKLWQVEKGKLYEPIVTTYDGLWRYRIADAIQIVGFDPTDGTPLLKYIERRNQSMRLPHALITQADIAEAVSHVDRLKHAEFTTWLDDRKVPPCVGFFVEASPGDRLIPSEARDALLSGLINANENFAVGATKGSSVKPSIRLLSPGSFGAFRNWKGATNGTGSSQIKVPLIMVDPKGQEFTLSRVIDEVR